jgi:hypothetical protein
MGQSDPRGQHQGGIGCHRRVDVAQLPFREPRGTAVGKVKATRVCAASAVFSAHKRLAATQMQC